MYYESYKKKPAKKRRVRRSFGGWIAHFLLKLLSLALVILIVGAGILYALPVSLFCIEPEGYDLSLTDGLPSSRINVLLLGMDVLNDNSQRSDTIIIASIGYQTLKLTSVLRDTVVDIPGHGSGKINAAFSYGGPELVMKTLNSNFDLNIMHYIAVDFTSLVALVDAIGGVEIDISEAEMDQPQRIQLSPGIPPAGLHRHGIDPVWRRRPSGWIAGAGLCPHPQDRQRFRARQPSAHPVERHDQEGSKQHLESADALSPDRCPSERRSNQPVPGSVDFSG